MPRYLEAEWHLLHLNVEHGQSGHGLRIIGRIPVMRRHTNALPLESSALVQEADQSPLSLGWVPYKGEIQSSGTEPAFPN